MPANDLSLLGSALVDDFANLTRFYHSALNGRTGEKARQTRFRHRDWQRYEGRRGTPVSVSYALRPREGRIAV
jgi:hypothetical protein